MEKRLRIITGIVLFIYVTMHLLNTATGLHSIELMQLTQPFLTGLWSNVIGGNILMIAMLIHLVLGLRSLYRRNTLNMAANDTVQLLAGLLIIPLLIPHFVGTAMARNIYNVIPDYPVLVYYFWIGDPIEGLRQVLLLVAVWVHGVIGILTWMKLRSWWPAYGPWINPLAVIIPVLALTGFAEAGRQALLMDGPPPVAGDYPTSEILASLGAMNFWALVIYGVAVAAVLIARYIRLSAHKGETEITYSVEDIKVTADQGLTILEASRANHVHHASLCNGRGRCGTCRVRVIETDQPLPDPSDEERETLSHFNAPSNVRLACQLKPAGGKLVIERLIPPDIQPSDIAKYSKALSRKDRGETTETAPEPAQ